MIGGDDGICIKIMDFEVKLACVCNHLADMETEKCLRKKVAKAHFRNREQIPEVQE